MRGKVVVCPLLALVCACEAEPLASSRWSLAQIRSTLEGSAFQVGTSAGPVLLRWRMPIEVNTAGIARAEEALRHYEQWTGGLIQFRRVSTVPANGIVFVEGDALGPSGTSCGNVHDGPPDPPKRTFQPSFDSAGALTGTLTIRLGSADCDDARVGHYPAAVAEHEVGHALGLHSHFPGFVGNEGFSNPLMLAVVYTLYANPVGTAVQSVRVYGVVP